jgi:hypothetical protein
MKQVQGMGLVREQGGSQALLFMNFGANRYAFKVSAEWAVRDVARTESADLQRGLDDMPRVHPTRTRHPDTMPTVEPSQPRVARSQTNPTYRFALQDSAPKQFPPRRLCVENEAAFGSVRLEHNPNRIACPRALRNRARRHATL